MSFADDFENESDEDDVDASELLFFFFFMCVCVGGRWLNFNVVNFFLAGIWLSLFG